MATPDAPIIYFLGDAEDAFELGTADHPMREEAERFWDSIDTTCDRCGEEGSDCECPEESELEYHQRRVAELSVAAEAEAEAAAELRAGAWGLGL